jgi:threonine synthase
MGLIAGYRCIRCGAQYPYDLKLDSSGCRKCRDTAPANLRPVYSKRTRTAVACQPDQGDICQSLWRYAQFLPQFRGAVVSLGEGLTPLLLGSRIGEMLDLPNLFIKDEGRNPTWSHKDRFSTVAVSAARDQGAKVVATASSGNAGASLAAYAAKAGLQCVVVTFAGAAGAMISQISSYGASLVPMARKVDRWKVLEWGSERLGWFVTSPYRYPVVGSHPIGIEGYKTLAYEIVDQSEGQSPDWCVLPVCYGDALAGLSAGFLEMFIRGKIGRVPRLVAAEVHGSLSAALESGLDRIEEQELTFETLALSIGTSRSTFQALKALRDTQGGAVCVTNHQLLAMQKALAASEGIFAELASVAPLVAIRHLRKQDIITRQDRVVAVVTASGLKDLDISTEPQCNQKPFENVEDAWQWLRARPSAKTSAIDHMASIENTR